MTPEEYVKTCLPFAKSAEAKSGFHYMIFMAQGAQESDWGNKAVGNNFFGVKDTDGINGNEDLVTTTEYSKSSTLKFPIILSIQKLGNLFKYKIKDYFRKYASIEDAFMQHADFFMSNPRYANAVALKNIPERFFEEIQKAGYATDPNYATNLKNVMHSVFIRLPK